MAILFSDSAQDPLFCFSNHSRYPFQLEGQRWLTVDQYLQAKSPGIAAGAWQESEATPYEERLRQAVLRKFEENLGIRSVLIGTGGESILADLPDDAELGIGINGAGKNLLGRVLVWVREQLRPRAENPDAVQCVHQEAVETRRVCLHIMEHDRYHLFKYYQWFSKGQLAFDLICPDCYDRLDQVQPPMRALCNDCFQNMLGYGQQKGWAGTLPVKETPTGMTFQHQLVILPTKRFDRIIEIQPVKSTTSNLWIGLTLGGNLVRVDLSQASINEITRIGSSILDLNQKTSLIVSPHGDMAGILQTRGRYGILFDLSTGEATMELDRGEYHIERCDFSAAFFEMDGRLLLVHAAAWNRLEITEPKTGELLTGREFAPWQKNSPLPEHYLDYFHGRLLVSPDQERIADWGWYWSPVGFIRTWSLRKWLYENPFESEDGSSVRTFCERGYYWDGPMCWVDADTLAVWGKGEDHVELFPSATVFDVGSGLEMSWFVGPVRDQEMIDVKENNRFIPLSVDKPGSFIFDRYLFSVSRETGTSVWDIRTGARLLHDPDFYPLGYHPGARRFITPLPNGVFRVSTLVGD